VSLLHWVKNQKEFIEERLLTNGAILFRDFPIYSIAEFENFIEAIRPDLLGYSYRSTPRSQVSGRIYTSTEYPAHQFIPLHNEMSYSCSWPMKIWFYCVQPADSGGETPIADSRKVFQAVPPDIREEFARKKLMYVRNYGAGLDLPWQNVFQTVDRLDVESFCRENDISFQWLDDDRLSTRQICQAVAKHPRTGENVWFNQAHLFHISNLEREIGESMLAAFKVEELPRNVYFGDGSTIDNSALEEIRQVYRQAEITFQWQKGDILMLDNMLTAHARNPFTGSRKIVVGMAEQFTNQNI